MKQCVFISAFILLGYIACIAQLPGQKNLPPSVNTFLGKHIRYPDDLVGIKSGFVVCQIQKDAHDLVYPVFLYSSHTDFAQEVISKLYNHLPAHLNDFRPLTGKILVFKFITHQSSDANKIYPEESRAMLVGLGVNRDAYQFQIESWVRSCSK